MKNFKAAVALLLVLVMALALAGCGKKAQEKPEEKEKVKETAPSEVVTEFFDAVKKQDSETIKKVYADGEFIIGDFTTELNETTGAQAFGFTNEFIEKIQDKMRDFDYKIGDEKVDGDKAVVTVDLTTYNLGDCVGEWWSEFVNTPVENSDSLDDEDYTGISIDLLSKAIDDAEKDYEESVDITLSKKDGNWIVDNLDGNDKFVDAFTGGIMPALDELEEELMTGEE